MSDKMFKENALVEKMPPGFTEIIITLNKYCKQIQIRFDNVFLWIRYKKDRKCFDDALESVWFSTVLCFSDLRTLHSEIKKSNKYSSNTFNE